MHSSNQRKEKGLLVKMDMANAFDGVNLSFLYRVLLSYGFSQEFVNFIKAFTDKPWIAPLVNGRPTIYFKAMGGLRQGYPLSPFLYILRADTLSGKLEMDKAAGNDPGLRIMKGLELINYALFADDSLLLGEVSNIISTSFKATLQGYCSFFRALINDSKSAVYGWNA